MDKISQIVRPNARVSSVDLNKSGSVRAGSPGFGRTAAESKGNGLKEISTADRAMMAANELADQRRASEGKIVDQMAHDFFMSKDDQFGPAAPAGASPAINPAAIRNALADLAPTGPAVSAPPAGAPTGYVPRGTFVDVRA